jgi:hypothetical protein
MDDDAVLHPTRGISDVNTPWFSRLRHDRSSTDGAALRHVGARENDALRADDGMPPDMDWSVYLSFVLVRNSGIGHGSPAIIVRLRKDMAPVGQSGEISDKNPWLACGEVAKRRNMGVAPELNPPRHNAKIIYSSIVTEPDFLRLIECCA